MIATAKGHMASRNVKISALDIAKYFIWKSNKESKPITNKKLQKLLYYAQAWHLILKEKPLFDDDIEAWIHGPAISSVYHKYKMYGFNPILEKVSEDNIKDLPSKDVLDSVWVVYGKFDGDYLEQLTHNEKPWQMAREAMEMNKNLRGIITKEALLNYYSSLLLKK